MDIIKALKEKTGGKKDYLSYSTLKYGHPTGDMRLFELKFQDKMKYTTPALQFGSLYDCLLLTPEKFDDRFVLIEDEDIVGNLKAKGIKNPRATKVYKDLLRKLEEDNPDKEMVNVDDHAKAIDMITRLEDCGIKELYLTGDCQAEFKRPIPTENYGDVMIRGFLDCLGDTFISDSKSTQSVHGLRWDIKGKYMYSLQAYLYREAYKKDDDTYRDFFWVGQEKTYPYLPAVYKASEETLNLGKKQFNEAIDNIARFIESDRASETHYRIDTI
jgi:hypothetical protein|tara:strand:+ start:6952 stop:7767 length:816 start_codon:yes stop_codon:yes gene_type:complete